MVARGDGSVPLFRSFIWIAFFPQIVTNVLDNLKFDRDEYLRKVAE